MPTVTFEIASAADDGSGYRSGVWPPAGSFTVDDNLVCTVGNYGGSGGGTDYATNVSFFRWDTSSIPDDATIVSASFQPWITTRGAADVGDGFAMVGDYYDFGGEPSVLGDWIFECSPSIFDEVVIEDIPSSDVRMDVPLTDLTGINTSGYTAIRCSLNNTVSTPSATNINFINLQTYEGAAHPAWLEVTYVVGTPVTFTIASAADDGSIWRGGGAWPPTGSYTVDDGGLAYAAKGNTYANVALFRWDTSSIPDDATITEAQLRPYIDSVNDAGSYSLVGDYHDFGGTPSDSSDWTLECSPSIFDAVDLAEIDGLTSGTQVSIQLTDLTGINVSGYTGIRCSLDGAGVTPVGDNSVVFRTYATGAELFVAYTEGSSVMWLGTN